MSPQIDALAADLVAAQKEIVGALKQSVNPHLAKSGGNSGRYADLSSVFDACKGPLNAHGISIVQLNEPSEPSTIRLRTMLLHKSGQWISGTIVIPTPKSDPQGYGSAHTYARRYGLMAAVGVCPEDDDGEGAKNDKPKPEPVQKPATPQANHPPYDLGSVKTRFDACLTVEVLNASIKSLAVPANHNQKNDIGHLYQKRLAEINAPQAKEEAA